MTAFLSGALGALAAVSLLAAGAGLARRAAWRRFHGRAAFGPARLLRRIGARPEQERAVLAETDALAEAVSALRGDARALREDLARLLAAPSLDAAAVAAALDARLSRARDLRARAADALARIHAALDPGQRAALAALVREGPHRHGRRCGRLGGAHA
jgi:Spy/CpxP family protein refolding chaperone